MRESVSVGVSGHQRAWAGGEGVNRGRRSVKKGEVVLRSTPFAHVIDAPYLAICCDCCIVSGRETLLRPCQECHVVWYCGDKCQEEALAWHRLECHALKRRQHNLPPDFVRLLARVILRLRNGGDKFAEKFSEFEGRRFRDLMSHYTDIKKNEEETCYAEKARKELGMYIGEKFLPNMTDFLGIYGRILVNRFSLMEKTLLNIGSAVYLAASIFDHDCSPNCHITFSGRTGEIRSLVDMPSFDFSKCSIAYVDPVGSTTARRQTLYKKWFFFCECKTCHNKERKRFENAVECEDKECRMPASLPDVDEPLEAALRMKQQQQQQRRQDMMMNGKEEEEEEEEEVEVEALKQKGEKKNKTSLQRDEGKGMREEREREEDEERTLDGKEGRQDDGGEWWAGAGAGVGGGCSVCGREVSEERRKQYWDAVAFTREKLQYMTEEDPPIQECLEMMERQQGLFSHMNAWRVRTYDFAFHAAMFRGCWSLALKYGEENHDGMRFYYGAESPVYCLFLYKLGKAKIYFKEFRQGVRILDEAEAGLSIALGDSHPILEELRLVNLSANEDIEICLERRIAKAKKQEEKNQNQNQSQKVQQVQQGEKFAPRKTDPWFSCEKDRIYKGILSPSTIA